jgi:hypothetical protein
MQKPSICQQHIVFSAYAYPISCALGGHSPKVRLVVMIRRHLPWIPGAMTVQREELGAMDPIVWTA